MPLIGSCHCGATRFEVAHAPESVISCTCSICSRRGALWAYYTPDQVKFTSEQTSTEYAWQTRTVKFHHCAVCGCSTWNTSPDYSTGEANFDNPQVSVNARLFEDFDLAAVPVMVLDGKNAW